MPLLFVRLPLGSYVAPKVLAALAKLVEYVAPINCAARVVAIRRFRPARVA